MHLSPYLAQVYPNVISKSFDNRTWDVLKLIQVPLQFKAMNHSELTSMICLMQSHGGSFVSSIATALRFADPVNRQRLLDAFPDLVEKYGPTSVFNKSKQLTEV